MTDNNEGCLIWGIGTILAWGLGEILFEDTDFKVMLLFIVWIAMFLINDGSKK